MKNQLKNIIALFSVLDADLFSNVQFANDEIDNITLICKDRESYLSVLDITADSKIFTIVFIHSGFAEQNSLPKLRTQVKNEFSNTQSFEFIVIGQF